MQVGELRVVEREGDGFAVELWLLEGVSLER